MLPIEWYVVLRDQSRRNERLQILKKMQVRKKRLILSSLSVALSALLIKKVQVRKKGIVRHRHIVTTL